MHCPVFTTELRGHVCVFLSFILDPKTPKFTYAKFDKKQVISKQSKTVVLCYLALNSFYIGLLVK